MNRKVAVSFALAIGVIAILLLWRPWSSERAEPLETPEMGAAAAVRSSPSERRELAPNFDVLADDDRLGTLVLEGQVIDASESAVADAIVTISSNPPRTAATGEDGSFQFTQLTARSYRLVARSGSGAAGPVTARLSDKSDPVILRLRPASSLEVTVLSLGEREPIAGATVELRGSLVERASTDADGVARLPSVPAGRYQLAGWSEGRATARRFVRIGAGASDYKEELLLAAGSSLSGRVLDARGAPVAEAQVLYASASERFDRAHPRFDAIVTDADGAFSFPALPKGTWRLSARHETLAPGTSQPVTLDGQSPVTGVEIRLAEGALIRGVVVTADGSPAPLAIVRAQVAARGNRFEEPRQAYADDGGRFELTGLPVGEMELVAIHESATSDTETVNTADKAPSTSVTLELALSGKIAGRVIDSAGEPVDGAQVRLIPDFRGGATFSRSEFRLRGFSTELSDAGGRFEFVGLRDDPYVVSASPPGSQERRRGPRGGGEPAKPGDLDLELVLEARATVVGKVAFEDGEAPAAFTISTGGFRAVPIPFSSKDGSFELADLEPQTTRLVVRGPGFDERTLPEVRVLTGETTDVGTIVVKAGRRVAGKVVDASGSPVENATVVIGARLIGGGSQATGTANRRFNMGAVNKETITDEGGAFALSGLGASELALVAEHPIKGRSKAVALAKASSSSVGLTVVLEAPGALEGKVTVNGAAGDSVRISARSKTANGAEFAVASGEDGTYRFDVLAPDQYLVSASVGGRRRGFGSISKSMTIEAGKTAALDLAFEGGQYSLRVAASAPPDGIGMGLVTVVDAAVKAATAAALESFLASREGGFSARGMIAGGEATEMTELAPGTYSVCVVALPREVVGPAGFEYLGREAESLAVSCVEATLAGSATEVAVSVPVVVPPFVPEPS